MINDVVELNQDASKCRSLLVLVQHAFGAPGREFGAVSLGLCFAANPRTVPPSKHKCFPVRRSSIAELDPDSLVQCTLPCPICAQVVALKQEAERAKKRCDIYGRLASQQKLGEWESGPNRAVQGDFQQYHSILNPFLEVA